MLIKHFDNCFGFFTFLFIGSKEDALNSLYKSPIYFDKENLAEFVADIQDKDAGLTLPVPIKGHDRYLIWMPEYNWYIEDFVTLSHECGHVASMAMFHRGIKEFQNDSTFHTFLYLKDSIYRDFLYQLKKELEKKEKNKVTDNIESVVNPEEESTADYEIKKEIEKTKKDSKKIKKK